MYGEKLKTCSRCKEGKLIAEFPKDRTATSGYHSHCKKCRSVTARSARGRRYWQKYQANNKKKRRAKNAVSRALKSGNLIKKPCEVCGMEPAEGHHCDYDKPLEVNWLCRLHHKQWHAEHGEAKTQNRKLI